MWREEHLGRLPGRPFSKYVAGNVAVVERKHPIGEFLTLLVTLAGDDNYVSFFGDPHSKPDRFGSVELQFHVLIYAAQDLPDDGVRILRPWVVGSDDDDVSETGRDPLPSLDACCDRGLLRTQKRRSLGRR